MTENESTENLETSETEETTTTTPGDEGSEKTFEFVEDPSFEVEYKGDCAYEVKVSVPPANESKLAEEVFEELRHEAEVPGFRRGRAPRKLIERKFARHVRSDVEQKLVAAAFEKLIKEKDLSPIGVPDVDGVDEMKERKDGEPINFILKFEVRAKCELGKYRGIEVERPVFKVADTEVDLAIDNYRARFSVFEAVEDGEAADGDQVIITFKGTVDGEAFPGGSAENYPYILGTKRFFPEFEAALLGAKPGSTVTCDVTFPEDYVENLRGKTAHFEITVSEIKRKSMPELTDEFATQAGYESMEDMRAKISARIQEDASEEGRRVAQDRAIEAVVNASSFELPKSMIKSMADDIFNERVERLRQMHLPAAQIVEQEPRIRENATASAESTIKRWVAIQEVAEAEGIEVTDADFEGEVSRIAQRSGASVEDVSRYLAADDRRGNYEMRLLEDKVLAALIEHANVTDREMTPEEFQAEMRHEHEEQGDEDEDAE